MNDVLIGGIEKREIVVVDYDPLWPEKFQQHAGLIAQALGLKALCVDHVGSTAVPGLAAKPIIDIVVVVENSGDEAAYLPALLAAGYVLRVRESNPRGGPSHSLRRGSVFISRLRVEKDELEPEKKV